LLSRSRNVAEHSWDATRRYRGIEILAASDALRSDASGFGVAVETVRSLEPPGRRRALPSGTVRRVGNGSARCDALFAVDYEPGDAAAADRLEEPACLGSITAWGKPLECVDWDIAGVAR